MCYPAPVIFGRLTVTIKTFAARVAASAILASALLGGASQARAKEIRLLSAASMQTVLNEIVGDFERTSGNKVIIRYSTMGAITERTMGGEESDLVISSPTSIASLVKEGRINAGSPVTISKTGVGIAVPASSPVPRIASVEDFKRALLAAKTVVYANPAGGGAAGIHIARVIEKLGITEQLKPKIKLAAGGDVTEVTLAQGDGALGMTQVSEIVGKAGTQFVRLPDELQNTPASSLALQSARNRARRSPRSSRFSKVPRPLPR
jgi:molybdate transport system substrate-binding protein